MPYVDGKYVPVIPAHGTEDTCTRCGHKIRMQSILFGQQVEPTWRSERDDSLWCGRPGQQHLSVTY